MDDVGVIELEAGEDYYLVAQPFAETDQGEYFFVFRAARAVSHHPRDGRRLVRARTAGQGFVMDVFDNANSMFLAWFTYDLERPGAAPAR